MKHLGAIPQNTNQGSPMKLLTIVFVLSLVTVTITISAGAQTARVKAAQKASEPQPGKPVVIPTRYDAHRFVATPVTANNVQLSLFTDSAGGLFLYADTAERLKLSIVTLSQKEHEGVRIVGLPNFKSGAMIPPPLGSLFEMRLFVFPRRAENDHGEIDRGDGMLGQQWFAGRVWTFDYPKQVLLWRAAGDLPPHEKSHEV